MFSIIKMRVNRRTVSVTTGRDIEAAKEKLLTGYYRLPSGNKPATKKPRRK